MLFKLRRSLYELTQTEIEKDLEKRTVETLAMLEEDFGPFPIKNNRPSPFVRYNPKRKNSSYTYSLNRITYRNENDSTIVEETAHYFILRSQIRKKLDVKNPNYFFNLAINEGIAYFFCLYYGHERNDAFLDDNMLIKKIKIGRELGDDSEYKTSYEPIAIINDKVKECIEKNDFSNSNFDFLYDYLKEICLKHKLREPIFRDIMHDVGYSLGRVIHNFYKDDNARAKSLIRKLIVMPSDKGVSEFIRANKILLENGYSQLDATSNLDEQLKNTVTVVEEWCKKYPWFRESHEKVFAKYKPSKDKS